jgi:hypothetical protein
VYQEGRAFPSCTVPIYVSANVPDRPRVKAAAAEFGRLSGYRFRDSSYSDASAHGIVVVWRGGTAPKGGGRANPTYRRSGGRLWTTWRIDLDHVGAVRHEWGHTMGWLHPSPPVAGNLMSNSTTIHPVQASTGSGVQGRVGTAEPWGVPLMATTYPWTSGAPHSPLVPGGLDWNWAYGFSSSSATVANVPAGYVTLHMELQNNFTVSGSAYPYFGISFPYPTLGMGTAPSSVAGPLVKTANAWDSVTWRFNAFTSGTTASFTFLHPGGEFSMQLSAGSGNRSHCFVGDPVWETFCPPGPPTIVKLIPASGPDTGGTSSMSSAPT